MNVTTAFRIQYDGSGVAGVERVGVMYDTDYFAANGSVGRQKKYEAFVTPEATAARIAENTE